MGFTIRIVTAVVAHDPAHNLEMVLSQGGEAQVFEALKLSAYAEDTVLLVLRFMQCATAQSVDAELRHHLVNESKMLKCIVHTMKHWYLAEAENVESRVLITRQCCQLITALCVDAATSKVASESHVTSSLIKLI